MSHLFSESIFASCGLVLKDSESIISGVEGNVGIVGEICFKFGWHICTMAQYNCFFRTVEGMLEA